ncbi:hypothetical protein A3A01_01360 [Candidatus Nomurabacteria bacterium RIFCSPLOWO2_01_FULL_39_17]|uniref:PilO n=1 Tax=Candidatus Nomurabacteria bacterium RIFCSPLOWO2_01_FULL_39_17 TaxID=1801770 RepID=A0A1F6WV58_9BACT|nr:MAG: hypothetical protein A3A01_01360 [Candidatus Nomurabacteria bacterium RIFCSPLOWO2_01_FULL_39_17]
MFRLIISIILISIAVTGFFAFTKPLFNDISALREQMASYDDALNNSKMLENERDLLTKKYNSFDPENIAKLSKLLPDNVDNIRLILEIEKIATPYGMVLKDIKYNVESTNNTTARTAENGEVGGIPMPRQEYGTLDFSFSTQGAYGNFINFMRDLEKNLRIMDITSIDFSSNVSIGASPSLSQIYKYNFNVKTYWLKN